jgi:hypothetical protein
MICHAWRQRKFNSVAWRRNFFVLHCNGRIAVSEDLRFLQERDGIGTSTAIRLPHTPCSDRLSTDASPTARVARVPIRERVGAVVNDLVSRF